MELGFVTIWIISMLTITLILVGYVLGKYLEIYKEDDELKISHIKYLVGECNKLKKENQLLREIHKKQK